jgi:hypothetical protein
MNELNINKKREEKGKHEILKMSNLYKICKGNAYRWMYYKMNKKLLTAVLLTVGFVRDRTELKNEGSQIVPHHVVYF